MRRREIAGGLVTLAFAASTACGVTAEGPPAIHVDRTACSHCGMLVSEPVYAAAYRAPGSDARVFDDIGCLLDAARKTPNADALRVWFHDAATADWVEGGNAVFVSSPTLRTPMGGGVIAYGDRTVAERAAVEARGRVIESLPVLLAQSVKRGDL